MNLSKNNLLFLFSGAIIAICLIATVILIGTENKVPVQKQVKTERQNEKKESDTDETASETKIEQKEATDKFVVPAVKRVDFSVLGPDSQEKIAALSIEDKVAQLFLISADSLTGVEHATLAGETTRNAINRYAVGGLIYDSGNIVEKEQIKQMLDKSNAFSEENVDLPLFLAVKDNGELSSPLTDHIEANTDPMFRPDTVSDLSSEEAYKLGNRLGTKLFDLGFNMNLAPSALMSADSFSFGTDPTDVSEKCLAFYSGLQSSEILGVYTDFPGKDNNSSTEDGIPTSPSDADALRAGSLLPYNKGLENASMIMLNSLAYPGLTSSVAPAFMSHKMVNDFIRDELGYKGLILTPSLDTADPSSTFTDAEMAVLALEAGCDMIYEPKDFHAAYNAVLEAVQTHRISEDRIDESLARIMVIKETLY